MLLLNKLFEKPVLPVLNDVIQHFQCFPLPSATAQCHRSFFKQVLLWNSFPVVIIVGEVPLSTSNTLLTADTIFLFVSGCCLLFSIQAKLMWFWIKSFFYSSPFLWACRNLVQAWIFFVPFLRSMLNICSCDGGQISKQWLREVVWLLDFIMEL